MSNVIMLHADSLVHSDECWKVLGERNELKAENESLRRDLDERTRPYVPMADVEPLSLSGIGQVSRHPASRCEQALCAAIVEMQAEMLQARSHLSVAILQSIDKDDQIIMDHVRDAARILGWKP